MKRANSVACSGLTNEREQPVHERSEGTDRHCRSETPRKTHMLEVALSGAARMSEEQAIDQSGGHEWRCPVFRKGSIRNVPDRRNSILLHQLKPKEKQ